MSVSDRGTAITSRSDTSRNPSLGWAPERTIAARRVRCDFTRGSSSFAPGSISQRARGGLRVELVIVQASDVAQAGEEGEEEAFRRRIALHRAAQVIRQPLHERGPDRGERVGLAGGGEQPALEAERQRDLLVERPRGGAGGPAADQRRLALHSFGQFLGQGGLSAERSLAQQQIVALEKADASGTLRRPQRNAARQPPQHAAQERRIGLMDREELCQK